MGGGACEGEVGVKVRCVRFIQNGHIYKYGRVENWSPDMIPVAFEG